jgi:hypothetical protein
MTNTNLEALLGKRATTLVTAEQETVVTIKLPHEAIEWIKNYRHAKSLATGNTGLTLAEAWLDAISALQTSNRYPITPRPDSVRKNEKKIGRKRKNQ